MKKTLLLILPLIFLFVGCEDEKEVDTEKPTVTITFSTDDSVSEVVSITCMSSDNEGVEKVELWVDGVNINQTMVDKNLAVDYQGQSKDAVKEAHLVNREALIAEGIFDPDNF